MILPSIFLFFGSVIAQPTLAFLTPSFSTGCIRTTPLHLSNPFSSILGDMANTFGGGGNLAVNPALDSKLAALGPSWEVVRESLVSIQTPDEQAFRDNLVKGYGPASPLHKVRLYDESKDRSVL